MSNIKETTNQPNIFQQIFGAKSSDVSLEDALKKLEGNKKDGVTAEEFKQVFDAISDYGQINAREAKQFVDWAKKNFEHLSPEAKQIFEKIDMALQKAGGGGVKAFLDGDRAVLSGSQLEALKAEIEKIAGGKSGNSGDGCGTDGVNHAPPQQHTEPSTHVPPPPPSSGASGTSGAGGSGAGSWEEILAMLFAKLGEKDKELKAKGEKLANQDPPATDAEMATFNGEVQAMNRLMSLTTNLQNSLHDTAKKVIDNLRV